MSRFSTGRSFQNEEGRVYDVSDVTTSAIVKRGGRAVAVSHAKRLLVEWKGAM